MAAARATERIDRVSGDDLMSLVRADDGPAMQVGAALLLGDGPHLGVGELREALESRLPGVRRLRQRLVPAPPGLGRPVWVDDAEFRIERHVDAISVRGPLDETAVLDVAAGLITDSLPLDRPLWHATLVAGSTGDLTAVVLVLHHVLADRVAGLAVLARLVDGSPVVVDRGFPRPLPSRRVLAADVVRDRLHALGRMPATARRLVSAATQLRAVAVARAARCSLNQPTGRRRAFVTARAELEVVSGAAHERRATVNDVVLALVAGALRRLLLARGESVVAFAVSVPFSARTAATASDLGNRSGVVTLTVPATGSLAERVAAVAPLSRAARRHQRGASTALLAPAFRLLSAVHLFGWFVRHQRRIHTFVSDLRGPSVPVRLLGRPVLQVVPLSLTTGNVSVAFTALSYAGELVLAVNADPDVVPDLDRLRLELQSELDGLGTRADSEGEG